MSPQQKVLFLNEPKGEFSVGLADIDEPGPGEILVEVHSTALNPVDWIVRDFDILIAKYPAIGGYDAAGIIKQVGEGVSNLTVGDEVYVFQSTYYKPGELTHGLGCGVEAAP